MELLKLTCKSLHGVIRTAAITIQDPAFKLLEFENMFPAQVRTGLPIISLIDGLKCYWYYWYSQVIVCLDYIQQVCDVFEEIKSLTKLTWLI